MPELPEVETIVRQLRAILPGRRVRRFDILRSDILRGGDRDCAAKMVGRRVVDVHRRAKRVLIELTPAGQCVFHLGMSGRLGMHDGREPRARHLHVRVVFSGDSRELRFEDPRRFGGLWLFDGNGPVEGLRLGEVGPEPLLLRPAEFRRLLARRRRIKDLLMDQRMIAGLGNIYCCEALHRARIHPLVRADEIDARQADRLLRAIKTTLNRAIRHSGSTYMDYRDAQGRAGSFQRLHRVYQRAGRACKTCGTSIERIVLGARSTFLCPQCQRLSP